MAVFQPSTDDNPFLIVTPALINYHKPSGFQKMIVTRASCFLALKLLGHYCCIRVLSNTMALKISPANGVSS